MSLHTKVFVGNLSFKTKAEELAAEFSAAGRVVSANIITRGPRSLGYGFVEMETPEEAQKAVTILNKKTVDSREINVEIAKPREDKPPQERGERRSFRGRRGGRGGRGGGRGGRGGGSGPLSGDNNNQGGNNNNNAPNQGAGNNNNNNNQGGGNNNNNNGQARRFPRRRFRGGRGGGPSDNGGNQGGNQGGQGGNNQGNQGSASPSSRGGLNQGQGGAPRRRRAPRRELSNRTPSPTTLFVANLPFQLDDDGLSKLFKEQKVSKAHVVKNRNGRSKGFGFVEFDNEVDQKAALDASSKLSAEGRELIVKIALTAPETKDVKDTPSSPVAAKDAQSAKTDEKSS